MAKKKDAAPEAVATEAKPKAAPKEKKTGKVVKLHENDDIAHAETVDPAQITVDQVIEEVKAEKKPATKKSSPKKKTETKIETASDDSDPLSDLFEGESVLVATEAPISEVIVELLETQVRPELAKAEKPKRERKEKEPAKPRQKGKEKLPEPVAVEFVPDEDINSIFIDTSIENAEEIAEAPEIESQKEEPKPDPKPKGSKKAKKEKESPEAETEEEKPEPAEPNPAPFVPEEMAALYKGIFVPESFYTKKAFVIEFLRSHYPCLNLNEVGRQATGSKDPIRNFQEMIVGKRKMPDKLVHPIYMFLAYKFGVGQDTPIVTGITNETDIITFEQEPAEFTRPPFGILFYQAEDGLVHAVDAGNIDFINAENADGMVLVNGQDFGSRELLSSFSAAALQVAYVYQYLSSVE